jgi:hypothetical protein
MLYHYKKTASGCSAKLAAQQVEEDKSESSSICSLAIEL